MSSFIATPYPEEMWLTTDEDANFGTGGGGSGTASFLVFESDGTSKLTLESGGGSLLLESST